MLRKAAAPESMSRFGRRGTPTHKKRKSSPGEKTLFALYVFSIAELTSQKLLITHQSNKPRTKNRVSGFVPHPRHSHKLDTKMGTQQLPQANKHQFYRKSYKRI